MPATPKSNSRGNSPLLGFLVDESANAFHFTGRLLAGNSHYFHQLGCHLSRHLVLNAAFTFGISFQKGHDFFFGDSGPLESVEKLTVADFTAQFFDTREEFFAICADARQQPGSIAAVDTLAHQ